MTWTHRRRLGCPDQYRTGTATVRPEGQTVMTTPKLREARRFASLTGRREVFEYHTSFGKGGRIHLRVDAAQRQVEIGYIGGHLPTARF